jgi:hypothetical protein
LVNVSERCTEETIKEKLRGRGFAVGQVEMDRHQSTATLEFESRAEKQRAIAYAKLHPELFAAVCRGAVGSALKSLH